MTIAAAAAALAGVEMPGDPASDEASDALALVELGNDPPFRIALGGPLWQDRTLRDGDARDFAQVVTDRPLEVEVRGGTKVRVAEVELRVDGRPQRLVAPSCDKGGCPTRLRLKLTPRLRRLDPGDHSVKVVARDSHGAASAQGFSVRTAARIPPLTEVDPVGELPPAPAPPRGEARLERAALAVIASERRRRGGLARALGTARLRVIQVGALAAGRRRLGATILVHVDPPRRDVWATVPAYVPVEGASPPYLPQGVRMHVAVLRDALIDVDLYRRRVIAFEPGPRSSSLSWAPSQAPAPAGADDES